MRCPPGPESVDELLPTLAAALGGRGAPLALLPADPADQTLAALRPDLPVEVSGIAAVVTTSGSTGEPKAVLLPAAALRASATATSSRLGGAGQWLLALPVHYVAGLQVVTRSLVAGTTPVVLDTSGGFSVAGFAAATARLDPGVRHYTAIVPTQLGRLLAHPAGRDALRRYDAALLGGSAAPDDLVERARAAGAAVVTTYGMSETCGGCVYDGVPLDDVLTDVRDDARVRLAGPVLAAGYRLRPGLTAAAFEVAGGRRWHTTPDVGRIAEDGRLEVLGRADDVAVSGGINVPLPAVERALATHPDVSAAACLAAPDAVWGERVVAFVVAGRPAPTLDELRAHVALGCPRTWAPRELVLVPELPLLTTGKTDRQALRELLRAAE